MQYNIEKVNIKFYFHSHYHQSIYTYDILSILGECFDVDDDNGRICGSITPDTVLYTLFRGKIEI